jgi:hypothetical protein
MTLLDVIKILFGDKYLDDSFQVLDDDIYSFEAENIYDDFIMGKIKEDLTNLKYKILTIVDNSSEACQWNGSVWILRKKK